MRMAAAVHFKEARIGKQEKVATESGTKTRKEETPAKPTTTNTSQYQIDYHLSYLRFSHATYHIQKINV